MGGCSAAQSHAEDMATRNYLAERDPDGKDMQDRLASVGLFSAVQHELGRGEHPQHWSIALRGMGEREGEG
jgi:hypothetical protein